MDVASEPRHAESESQMRAVSPWSFKRHPLTHDHSFTSLAFPELMTSGSTIPSRRSLRSDEYFVSCLRLSSSPDC